MFNWFSRSLKLKVFLMFMLAGAIPMLIAIEMIHLSSRDLFFQKTEEKLRENVISREVLLRHHLDALIEDANILASLNAIESVMEHDGIGSAPDAVYLEAGHELAEFQMKLWGKVHHIFIANTEGEVVLCPPNDGWMDRDMDASEMRSYQGPHTGDSIAEAHSFESALASPRVSDFFDFFTQDHYHQLILSPIKDPDGKTLGVVVFEVEIDEILRMLNSDSSLGEKSELYLTTYDGERVVHLKEDRVDASLPNEGVVQAKNSLEEAVLGWFSDDDGHEVYGAYLASSVYPWVVCDEIDAANLRAPLRAQQRRLGLVLILNLLLLGCTVLLMGRRIWRPLAGVVKVADRVADGNLWMEIDVKRKDEIGKIRSAIEYMRKSMKQQIDHLDSEIAERTAELEYANEQLEKEANEDKLTGLANRAVMSERIREELEQFHNNNDHLISVLFFDFDRFKIVNDSLGHAVGDALLCSIAERFEREVRDLDLAARFGGDEFVVCLGPVESPSNAREAADRLLEVFAEPHDLEGHRIVSTASIGLVTANPRYETAEDLIRDADAAMYQAKLAGKGQVVVFDDQMRKDVQQRQRIEEELAHALERDQFRTYFQPIIGMESTQLVGFEALIRWEHPEMGLVRPDHFIPIAEDTGLIVEIGQWIMRDALEHLAAWERRLGLEGALTMNVNVAKRQLIQPDFIEKVQETIAMTGVRTDQLKVEITESTAIDPRHDMSSTIKAVHDLGIQVAMDDFGTGHSSLSLLSEFELDIIKIDKSFITGMEGSREMCAVLHSIIALAQNMGKSVVAEGVETEAQIASLISLGCDMIQGYYFSRPLVADDAFEYITSSSSRNDAA